MKKGMLRRWAAFLLAGMLTVGGTQVLPTYAQEDDQPSKVAVDEEVDKTHPEEITGLDSREATTTEGQKNFAEAPVPEAVDEVNTASEAGVVKVHMVTCNQSTNAFILECDGRFAVVDSGEDQDYPANPRWGVNIGQGIEEKVIAYMHKLGVNGDNFDYYIGTHAHSDHIGSADEVIREFHPKTVVAPKYEDEFMSSDYGRFDNLYVQNHMIDAAKEVGAEILLNTPTDPYSISLGSASMQIYNGARDIKPGTLYDVNEISLGVKITGSNGKTAFIGGDINDVWGVESRLKDELGQIDVCSANHHGIMDSNTYNYMKALNPKIILFPSDAPASASAEPDPQDPWHNAYQGILELLQGGTRVVAAGDMASDFAVTVHLNENLDNNIPDDLESVFAGKNRQGKQMFQVKLKGGFLQEAVTDGYWMNVDGRWRYRVGNRFLAQGFETINGVTYYFLPNGYMATGWVSHDNKWYYASEDGSMASNQWVHSADGKWYYIGEDGLMLTNAMTPDGYYVDHGGVWLQTGRWIKDSVGWWYRYPNGSWPWDCLSPIDGQTYGFGANGYMHVGWFLRGSTWYYATGSGALMKNQWLFYGGVWYYLKGDGKMAVSEMTPDGYYVDGEGRYITPQTDRWMKNHVGWWYCYADGSWPSNKFVTIDGKVYYFNQEGYMQTGWIKVGKDWYYAEDSGSIVFSRWISDKGVWYYLMADGRRMESYKKNK